MATLFLACHIHHPSELWRLMPCRPYCYGFYLLNLFRPVLRFLFKIDSIQYWWWTSALNMSIFDAPGSRWPHTRWYMVQWSRGPPLAGIGTHASDENWAPEFTLESQQCPPTLLNLVFCRWASALWQCNSRMALRQEALYTAHALGIWIRNASCHKKSHKILASLNHSSLINNQYFPYTFISKWSKSPLPFCSSQ